MTYWVLPFYCPFCGLYYVLSLMSVKAPYPSQAVIHFVHVRLSIYKYEGRDGDDDKEIAAPFPGFLPPISDKEKNHLKSFVQKTLCLMYFLSWFSLR